MKNSNNAIQDALSELDLAIENASDDEFWGAFSMSAETYKHLKAVRRILKRELKG